MRPELLCALLLAGCNETVVRIVPISLDAADTAEVPVDPSIDDAAAEPPEATCPDICAFLWECSGGIDPSACGAMCARFTTASRACLHEVALTSTDCYDVEDCNPPEYPESCYDVCDPYTWHCLFDPCYFYCPYYTPEPVACALEALDPERPPDCEGARTCLTGHEFGTGCGEACAMALACGLPALDSCTEACSALLPHDVSRACIDSAVHFDDCEALAACGGLWP